MGIARVVAAVGLAAVVLAGCSHHDDPLTHGPLSGATHGSSVYVCAPVGKPAVFGLEQFTNNGHAALVLSHVGLRDPRGEHLVDAVAIPGQGTIGVTRGWPPSSPDTRRLWPLRQPVHGFRLAPGETFNMVLDVAATTTPRGTTPGLVLHYHDAHGSYVVNDGLGMQVITGHCPK